MTEARWTRMGGAAGLAYVLFLLVSSAVGGTQPAATDRAKITSFFVGNHSRILIGSGLTEVTLLLFLCFLLGLTSTLRRVEAGSGGLSTLALACGSGYVILALIQAVLLGATAFMVSRVSDSATVTGLFDVQFMALNFLWLPLAVMLGAVSFVALHTVVFPRWFAWAGFVVGGASLIRSIGVFVNSGSPGLEVSFSYLLFLIWVVMASIVMMRRTEPAPSGESELAPRLELTRT